MPEIVEPIYINHPLLPPEVKLAAVQLNNSSEVERGRQEFRGYQKKIGRKLINKVISANFGSGQCHIFSEESGKPYARLNDGLLQISIAHCSGMVCGAVSENRVLGVDIEHSERNCYPGLRDRLKSSAEESKINNISTLQLWTVKEAALKWSGTGLRTPMNKIIIKDIENSLFTIEFPDQNRISICSFYFKGFWLSVAYGPDLND
jgi:phosphopantetheinyl transferase